MVGRRMDEIRAARESAQPVRSRTGGSTFANLPGAKAWELIERAGCRGLAIGGATVSEQHCNFLINTGHATAADLEALGEEVRRRVLATTGEKLCWEIHRVGVPAEGRPTGGRAMSKRVAVLMGGWSSEREVSLVSGAAVAKALTEAGYAVRTIDVARDPADLLTRLAPRPDVIFNALHGRWGEDGTIQGLLDILAIPYTHSGLLASALAMHKPSAKVIFEHAGIPVAEHVVVGREALADGDPMPRPYVIKPLNEGSSVGVRIVRNGDNPPPLCADWSFGDTVMVERFIPGREFTVAVMGDRPLAVTEITTERGFYDYDAKYAPGGSRHVIPAQVEPAGLRRGDGARLARASGARLSRRLARRSALRRSAPVHARGQYPAGDDADLAGPRAGCLRRHQLPRPGCVDGRKRGVRRMTRGSAVLPE